jgi:hypothetical protein
MRNMKKGRIYAMSLGKLTRKRIVDGKNAMLLLTLLCPALPHMILPDLKRGWVLPIRPPRPNLPCLQCVCGCVYEYNI